MLSEQEYKRRYPSADYDLYVRTEEMLREYYSKPSAEISRDLIAQHDEDAARGWSTD